MYPRAWRTRRPVWGRALTVATLVALATLVPGAPTATAAPTAAAAKAPVPGPVVLIGTGGLRWDDVDAEHPALQALREDATGLLAVRSVRATTCPADGWLAVSAGRRAADLEGVQGSEGRQPACRDLTLDVPTPGGTASVPRWGDYVEAATRASFDAEPGLLGRTLATTKAVAVGPGAAIALAAPAAETRQATVARAFEGGTGGNGGTGTVDALRLADDVERALALDPDVLVVDVGAIRDPAQRKAGEPQPTGAYAAPREEQVDLLDERLGLVLGQLPPSATVVVASLADAGPTTPQLQLLAARGPAPVPGSDGARQFSASLLGSRSTRQDGIAQSTDLLPTLLVAAGVRVPQQSVGSPLQPVGEGDTVGRLQRLADIDTAATAVRPIVPWFFNGFVIAQVLLYGVATIALRRGRASAALPAAAAGRRRTLRTLRALAVVFATVPAATFLANLVPWWRGSLPGLTVTVVVAGFMVPLSLLALLGPWRSHLLGPLGAVGGMTSAVLAADVFTGSRLTLSSLMGVQPVVAGRWYGFSNPGFALFATGSLLLAIAVADVLVRAGRTRAAVAAVAGIGLVATVIDGTPGLGSDFGGPPAIIPAFGVLALLVAGIRITWRRAALIGAVTVAVLAALSVADWLRPAADRTHLGRFVQEVLDGGAWSVISRKLRQNLGILFKPISLLLPVAVAFVAGVLARPVSWGVRPLQLAYDRSPVLKHGLVAFGVLMALGFALNDSGTAIPAVAATVAIPLLIAVSVRALELDDEARLEAALARARKPTTPRR